jgi:thiamine pyrophosphokinase
LHDFDKSVRALSDCVLERSAARAAPIDVVVFGALGGSVTHEFAAFNTLMRYSQHPFLQLSLASQHNLATAIPSGRSTFRLGALAFAPYCGIIPLGASAESVTTTGFRWNLSEPRTALCDLFLTTCDLFRCSQRHAELWRHGQHVERVC